MYKFDDVFVVWPAPRYSEVPDLVFVATGYRSAGRHIAEKMPSLRRI